ncbi:hypothetical protein ACFVZW_19455 [Streptomyces sp. NPDC059567]|uniref:hypothetical protein n=1 Tax=Streptomyces sp. NPDC059567 TaxID=3346867 RepID=UPI0036C3E1D0
MLDRTPGIPLTEAEAKTVSDRLLREAIQTAPAVPAATSFRDHTPTPAVGDTPPVPQPDSRTVPQWATGIAVASIGIGAGVTGIGCGAWLVLEGLSSITLAGVLAIAAPFAGVAVIATAIGAAVSKAKAASITHVYQGTVIKRTEVSTTTNTRGMFSRTRNDIHG